MSDDAKELGVLHTLLDRFNTQIAPRLDTLRQHVNDGKVLSETDLEFLQRIFDDANRNHGLVQKHPEFYSLYARAIDLFKEITTKGLENEEAASKD